MIATILATLLICIPPKVDYRVPKETKYDTKIINYMVRLCKNKYETCPVKITKLGVRNWDVRCGSKGTVK
jgi:hypothetical protein